ncbi:P-loop containing nucleoside triphosphate hydrolase protein [Ceratobasidium sp. AG-I]|nr:P-loop containing nucleoside triphosphate hydrolase protein [Ceratobasidium sp. AG-I]
MATRLGKRSRPQHAGQSSSPIHPTKDIAGAPNSVIVSPPSKRLRTSIGSLVNGKENIPLSVRRVGVHDRESRTLARAIVREEAERGEEAGDDDESSEEGGNDAPSQPVKSKPKSIRMPSPIRTPSKAFLKSRGSPTKKSAQATPRLPSLVSKLQLTPPATPPTTTLSLHARARALLRPGPSEVIGREKERAILTDFLSSFVAGGSVGQSDGQALHCAAYISGAPGTGKTALVSEVLRTITVDGLRGVYVNCTGLKEENSVWARVLEEGNFGAPKGKASAGSEKKRFETALKTKGVKCIVVLDELDFILQSPSALSSIFAVATAAPSALRIIGISNTLTLGASGSQPTKLNTNDFLTLDVPAYTAEDIVKIVQGRLAPLEALGNPTPSASAPTTSSLTGASLVIAPTALTFLSKKVAAQTGDLRAAFDAVRRTIELVEREVNPFAPPAMPLHTLGGGPSKPMNNAGVATMKHVLDSLRGRDGLAGGQAVGTARGLGMQARLVLVSILVARRRAAAGLVLLPVKSVNSLTRTPSKAAPRTPSKTGRGAQPGSPSKRGRAGDAEMYEASALHAAYSAILTSDGAFAPVSRSEFQDLLGVLETGGLITVVGATGNATPSRRKAAGLGGEPLVGLAEGVREEDVLRGLGSAGAGGTAGVKEEEAMALWERELKRSLRDVERVKRAAEREREAMTVDGFADACAND